MGAGETAAAGVIGGPWGVAGQVGLGMLSSIFSGEGRDAYAEMRKAEQKYGQISEGNFGLGGDQYNNIMRGGVSGNVTGQQQALANMYMQQLTGQGPSLADMQARQSGQAAMQQQSAMAAGAPQQNAAMAARVAAQQQGNIGSSIAGQAAMARAAEQSANMAGMQQLMQGMGSQELQGQSQQQQALAQYFNRGMAREDQRMRQTAGMAEIQMAKPTTGQRWAGMLGGMMPLFGGTAPGGEGE